MIPPRRARELHKRLGKKAKRGFRGFPVGTVALYGPDDRRATKLVAAVIAREDDPPSDLRRYLAAEGDVRQDPTILEEVVLLFEAHGVRSVVMVDRIIARAPRARARDAAVGVSCRGLQTDPGPLGLPGPRQQPLELVRLGPAGDHPLEH